MVAIVDRQMDQHLNILVYSVQIWISITWSCWWWILAINLIQKLNESYVFIFCVWSLLGLKGLHAWQPVWTVNWIKLLIVCLPYENFYFYNMVVLVEDFGDEFHSEIEWIIRCHFCVRSLLKLKILHLWQPIWTVKSIQC